MCSPKGHANMFTLYKNGNHHSLRYWLYTYTMWLLRTETKITGIQCPIVYT